LAYDIRIKDNFSINIAGLGTYASKSGFGKGYMEFQNDALSFTSKGNLYSPQQITGWGVMIQPRHYLLPNANAPIGLYAGPYLMYRKVWITSETTVCDSVGCTPKDTVRNLNIFAGGVLIGGRLGVVKNIFSIDFYVGAGIKLSKYKDESKFTRFRKVKDLDFSGVTPTIGLSIGILK